MFGRKGFIVVEDVFKIVKKPNEFRSSFYQQHLQARSCQTSSRHWNSGAKFSTTTINRSIHTNNLVQGYSKPPTVKMQTTGPLAEMLARNGYMETQRMSYHTVN